jgi:RNA polymerase sigma factor (sigma-70 family)
MLDDVAIRNYETVASSVAEHTTVVDELLRPYLQSGSESESSEILERLICDFALPIIRDIVSFKLRLSKSGEGSGSDKQDAEDICGDVTLRLMDRLHQLKEDQLKEDHATKPIANLRSYFAVMAYNACDQYLRKKYPERHKLKNKIRYLLSRQKGFDLWEASGGRWLTGYAVWRNADWSGYRTWETDAAEGAGLDLEGDLPEYELLRNDGHHSVGARLAALIDRIFSQAGHPIELDALVSAMASICGIKDRSAESAERSEADEEPADPGIALDEAMDNRALAARMWAEIRELPLRQRAALLLHLKDSQGQSVLTLLPRIRVASIREIAATLEVDPYQMASLWNELPLEDSVIAERLQATRQQVINLRKSARERLTRRLGNATR